MALTIHPVVAGTAGHIDHGKSSLVKALTGVDPDRLKEEKERGMTLDLGFAPLPLADGRTMGLVDVPGHERLVRNMVAGATGLDLAILVVAADDGVMPQTLEHIDILDLLGTRRGIVALTKIDLVDADTQDLAEEDVRAALEGTALARFAIARLSTVTGEGLPEFRARLEELALATPVRSPSGAFRMPLQRVFVLKGIGTVVTGIPVSGSVQIGDEIEFLPGAARAKVRAIQAYKGQVQKAIAGHSTALSVPDAREANLARGMVAAAPGAFVVGTAIDVDLRTSHRSPPLEHRMPVRFHTGTIEVQGELLLLGADVTTPGEALVARIELAEPVCAAPGDRFLLRLQNPPRTVGGGKILRLAEPKRRYRRHDLGVELQALQSAGADIGARVRAETTQAGAAGFSLAELASRLGEDPGAVATHIAKDAEVRLDADSGHVFAAAIVASAKAEIVAAVDRILRDKPLAASIPRTALQVTRQLPLPLQALALRDLVAEGRVRSTAHGRLLFVDRLKPLPPAEQRRLDALVQTCETAAFRPPSVPELAAALGGDPKTLPGLLARATDEGLVDQVGEHVYGATTIKKALVAVKRNCLRHAEDLEIPELRDELGTSRKYLIPLLEYVDALGLTRLRGGIRKLLTSSPLCQALDVAANP